MRRKVLVAFFSVSGRTEELAYQIADVLDARLFEIKAINPYTAEDLDYNNMRSRVSIEMTTHNSRPDFIKRNLDMSEYDTIFLGFPIWWGMEPKIIDTFLEYYDLAGKTIFPFATSGGSDIIMAENSMKLVCPEADIRQGQIISPMNAKRWARSVM